MTVKFEPNEINELKDEFFDLFNIWVERVTPTFDEPFFTLGYDEIGFYLSLTKETKYDASITWEKFAEEILDCDDQIIQRYLPYFKSLVQKMEEKLEGEQ